MAKTFSSISGRLFFASGVRAPSMRFSRTVISGKRRRASGTWAIPSVTISCGARVWIGFPSYSTEPFRGLRREETVARVVVLPEPFAPMRATISPCFTSNETSQRTCTSP